MVCLHKSVGPERQWMILFLQDTFTEWAITAACLERKPMNLSCSIFKLKIINEEAGGWITWQSKCDYLFVLFASPSIFSSFYNEFLCTSSIPFSSLHSLLLNRASISASLWEILNGFTFNIYEIWQQRQKNYTMNQHYGLQPHGIHSRITRINS